MDGSIDFKALAAQLAKPEGESGIKTAEHMNINNADMTRHAVDLLGCSDHDHVLEIGPGNGRFAAYVLAKGTGIHYTGADISKTMITAAGTINAQYVDTRQVTFTLVDGIVLPFPDDTFNHVFTVNTLYFWKHPAKQLAEIKRVLKPSGTFCLAIASKAFMEQLPFTAFGFKLYTPKKAQKLLLTNGFDQLDTEIREQKITGSAQQEMVREEVFILAS